MKILIVDDDPEIHHQVRLMLNDPSLTLESAGNFNDALVRLQSQPYDVVLTDIPGPDPDGFAFLDRIAAIRPQTKVLVMSAGNRPDRVAGSMRGHAASYVSKPFSAEQLKDALTETLILRIEPDDIEVLSDKPNWITVRAPCKLEIAERLTRFFRELPSDLDQELRDGAATAFRELFINAVEHGGQLDPEKKVELHFIRTNRSIVYYVRDPGQGFSMEDLPHAAISSPADPLNHVKVREEMGVRAGGFGLLLLNNFADELIYNKKGNEVILIKRL